MNQHNITPSNSLQEHNKGTSNFSLSDCIDETNEAIIRVTNRFPIEAFPELVQYIIRSYNESQKFNIDFFGTSILYAASIAIGNTYEVEVSAEYRESAVIIVVIVGRPGTGKTPPLKIALKPIKKIDADEYKLYEALEKEYDRITRLSASYKKDNGIEEPEKPVWKKIILSDYTPEALAEVHRFNKRGIGVYVDELAGWFKNFNKYNKGSEMEFWLGQWSGASITIDRKTSDPIFINSPFISVGGTIQTGILNELAGGSRTQNGFIDRMLFALPDNLAKEYYSQNELPADVYPQWSDIINKLLDLKLDVDDNSNPVRKALKLSPEAKEAWLEWQIKNTDECNDAETDHLAGMISKMEIHVFRIALILELLRFACNESNLTEVGIESFRGAIQLTEYFKRSAMKVHSILSNSDPLEKLSMIKKNIYSELPDEFSTNEGVIIATKYGMPERTFKNWLKSFEYFSHLNHGKYRKIIS
ncbi:MAG: YfjI family protein [Sediminibacterium sp.]